MYLWSHPKPCEKTENQNLILSLKHPNTTTFHWYLFHLIFVHSEIWSILCTHLPNFQPFVSWTFWPKEPQNLHFTFPSSYIVLKTNSTNKAHKILVWPLIFTTKLLYTYFWWMLPLVIGFCHPVQVAFEHPFTAEPHQITQQDVMFRSLISHFSMRRFLICSCEFGANLKHLMLLHPCQLVK